jgi:hypothetical protein
MTDMPIGFRNIEKQHLLLVEDDDDAAFFNALLEHWGFLDVTEVWPIGRGEDFKRKLGVLKTEFAKLKSVGVVQDANDDPSATYESIKRSLENHGLTIPDRYGQRSAGSPITHIIILPNGLDGTGGLESLCIGALEDDPVLSCVNDYIESLKELGVTYGVSDVDKAKVKAYLASDSLIRCLGDLASYDALSLDNDVFEKVKTFVFDVCNI